MMHFISYLIKYFLLYSNLYFCSQTVLSLDCITIFLQLTTPDILDLGLAIEPKSAENSVVCSGFAKFLVKNSQLRFY